MPSFADRARAGIARVAEPDQDAWLAFQQRSHGSNARQADPAWVGWLADHPANEDGRPVAWICRRDGEIVGSQGGIPFRLKEGDTTVPGSWAVDLMVEPEWRLRGVGPALTDALTRGNAVVAGLQISDAAYRAYRRGGWRDLGDIPNFIRPSDVDWSVGQLGLTGRKRAMARLIGRPAVATTRVGSMAVARAMRSRLTVVDCFDDRVDALWVEASPAFRVAATRDRACVSWRFDSVPDAAGLTRWYLMQGSRLRAYAVTRLEEWRDGRILVILDYVASPRWTVALLAQLTARGETVDAAAVTCRTLNLGAERAFRAAGFIRIGLDERSGPLDRAPTSPVRFMVYQGDAPERPAFDRRSWFITSADSDLGLGTRAVV